MRFAENRSPSCGSTGIVLFPNGRNESTIGMLLISRPLQWPLLFCPASLVPPPAELTGKNKKRNFKKSNKKRSRINRKKEEKEAAGCGPVPASLLMARNRKQAVTFRLEHKWITEQRFNHLEGI